MNTRRWAGGGMAALAALVVLVGSTRAAHAQ